MGLKDREYLRKSVVSRKEGKERKEKINTARILSDAGNCHES